ncbi:MAG: hypothetical protein DRN96_08660 [Thermoproteota archaeon]|nr:MAG: hypothetical protein DRN96_08660 [Candidatus Korarchaeota archaeon]RLG55785.1 MAG: hypothetical protein DRN99_01670 [Candidatus Korarchaeota archaeon]
MSEKGAKLLVRQIAAIVIAFIILWVVSRVLVIEEVVLREPVQVRVVDLAKLLMALIVAGLIKGLGGPLSEIYHEAAPSKAEAISGVTDNILNIVALAILYMFLRELAVAVLQLFLPARTANVAYDLVFIIAGLLIVYSIVKAATTPSPSYKKPY